MKLKKLLSSTLWCAFILGVILASCDTTGISDSAEKGHVKLQFKTVTGNTAAKTTSSVPTLMQADSLIIEGTNGTLQIDDIRFIVEKFKLEPADVEDDTVEAEREEFEAEPFFVDLPLTEDTLSLANSEIQTGLYEELEFEVKDLDFEDEEEGEDAEHQALADSIRAVFPDWPDEASMVITGTFTPTGGEPQPFKVFAKAEIEIEMEFEPPLEVTESNMQQVVSVRINPTRWVMEGDAVFDLSQYDWDERQTLLEFSAKFKDGVEEIEVDEEEFDDDEDDDEDDDDDDD